MDSQDLESQKPFDALTLLTDLEIEARYFALQYRKATDERSRAKNRAKHDRICRKIAKQQALIREERDAVVRLKTPEPDRQSDRHGRTGGETKSPAKKFMTNPTPEQRARAEVEQAPKVYRFPRESIFLNRPRNPTRTRENAEAREEERLLELEMSPDKTVKTTNLLTTHQKRSKQIGLDYTATAAQKRLLKAEKRDAVVKKSTPLAQLLKRRKRSLPKPTNPSGIFKTPVKDGLSSGLRLK